MSLSVRTKTLDILNHVTLYASGALMCGSLRRLAGGSSTKMLSTQSVEEKCWPVICQ